MYIHVRTAWVWRLKGHNPGLKGFRCVQLHNVQWHKIPIPHCSWGKRTSFWCQYDIILIEMPCCMYFQSVDQVVLVLFSLVMDTSSLSILYIIISLKIASFLLFAKGLQLSVWSMLLTLDRFLWLLTIVSCHCQLYKYGTYYAQI